MPAGHSQASPSLQGFIKGGERLACVGWIQSLIRRPDQRELLFDLERVRWSLPDGESRLLIDKSVGNLLRMWAET